MDKLEKYRNIVINIVNDYARYKPSNGRVHTEAIKDVDLDHYEVMHVGWDGHRRIHGTVIHIDIINGRVWVQYDGTNRPVVDALMEAGIPNDDIVLGFHPADVRQHTGFAIE